jgi:hypothetical protein
VELGLEVEFEFAPEPDLDFCAQGGRSGFSCGMAAPAARRTITAKRAIQ